MSITQNDDYILPTGQRMMVVNGGLPQKVTGLALGLCYVQGLKVSLFNIGERRWVNGYIVGMLDIGPDRAPGTRPTKFQITMTDLKGRIVPNAFDIECDEFVEMVP